MSNKIDSDVELNNQTGKVAQKVALKKVRTKKMLVVRLAVVVLTLFIFTGGVIATTSAIFTNKTQQSNVVSFSSLNVEAEVQASDIAHTNSCNVKYISNYYNDTADELVNYASVKTTAGSLDSYIRAQAQYAFVDVEDSVLTDNLKMVITRLNNSAITTYNAGTYKWVEYSDGYYYLTDASNVPISAKNSRTYVLISNSSPIKYNAISPLGLEFTTAEEQIMTSLGLVVNFECVQVVNEYNTIASLKVGSGEFNDEVSQQKSFGNILQFNTNGGDDYSAVLTSSNSLGVSSYIPTREGYDFTGWKLYNEDVTAVTFNTSSIVEINATWKAKEYNITYLDEGGVEFSGDASELTSSIYTYGSQLTLPTNLTKAGYTFAGWYLDSSCTQAITTIMEDSIGDLTVYAKWSANKLTITYAGMENAIFTTTSKNTFNYNSNEVITFPTAYKNGYEFIGWFTEPSGQGEELPYLSTSEYSDNVTVYAYFTPKTYSITFLPNGGMSSDTSLATITYNAISNFTLYNADSASKQGYKLAGWQVVSDSGNWQKGTIYLTGSTYYQEPVNYRYGDVVLQAYWVIDTFETNLKLYVDGELQGVYGVTIGATFSLTENYNLASNSTSSVVSNASSLKPKKAGYIFVGWSLNQLATEASYTVSYLAEQSHITGSTINLYAVWKSVSYYSIVNGSDSNYAVYAVASDYTTALLFQTNTLQTAFEGVSICSGMDELKLHFGNNISNGIVSGDLNIGSDSVSFGSVQSKIVDFVNGSIVSTKAATGLGTDYITGTKGVFVITAGSTINLGTENESFSVAIKTVSYMFSLNGGDVNLYSGLYQVGTSLSKIDASTDKCNPAFGIWNNASNFHVYGGSVIGYYKGTSSWFSLIQNRYGKTIIDDGYFMVTDHSIIYNVNTGVLTINGGTFVNKNESSSDVYGLLLWSLTTTTITGGSFECKNRATPICTGSGANVTISGGRFESNSNVLYAYKSAKVSITGGTFVSIYENYSQDYATFKLMDSVTVDISGGEIIAQSTGENSACGIIYGGDKSLTIGGTASVVSNNSYGLVVKSSATGVVNVKENASIISLKKYSAISNYSSNTINISGSAYIDNNSEDHATIEVISGTLNITGYATITNTSYSGASAHALYTQDTALVKISPDSGYTYASDLRITIQTYSKTAGAHAICHTSQNGESPLLIVDECTSCSGYVFVQSNSGSALSLASKSYASINGGLFTSELSHAIIVLDATFDALGNAIITKNYSDVDNILVSTQRDKSALFISGSATVNIGEETQVNSYDSVALLVDGDSTNSSIVSVYGSAQVRSETTYAIQLDQQGQNSQLYLSGSPKITTGGSNAVISFSKLELISASNRTATEGLNVDYVITVFYSGENVLISNDIVVKNVPSGQENNFAITNPNEKLLYRTEYLTLVIAKVNSVEYNSNGGASDVTIVDNNLYQNGEVVQVIFSDLPTKDGYMFLGWSTQRYSSSPEYTKTGTTSFIMGENNVVLYAIYRLEFVKLYYGDDSSNYTLYASLDDAFTAYNTTTTTSNKATFVLLRSNLALSTSYSLSDTNLTGFTTGYKTVKSNAKNIVITADLPDSATTPKYTLNIYSANNAFVIGSGYSLTFTNLIVNGNAFSTTRSGVTGRLAYLTSSTSSLTFGKNAIIQNFNITTTAIEKSGTGYFGGFGGLVYQKNGEFNIIENAIVQNCSVYYTPTSDLVNSTSGSGWYGDAGGSVIASYGGTINVTSNASIVDCKTYFKGSWDSGNFTAYLQFFGAIYINGATANFDGTISNCNITAINTHESERVATGNVRDKIVLSGAGISVWSPSTSSVATLNVNGGKIQGCTAVGKSNVVNVDGIGIYLGQSGTPSTLTTSLATLNATDMVVSNNSAGNSIWLDGSINGGGLLVASTFAHANLTNCTFNGNSANTGSSVCSYGWLNVQGGEYSEDGGHSIFYLNGPNNSTLTTNGTTTSVFNNVTISAIGIDDNRCLTISNATRGVVEITNCTMTAQSNATIQVGKTTNACNASVNIKDSTITSVSGYAILSYSYGKITIENSTASSTSGKTIYLSGSNVNNYKNKTMLEIKSGTISSSSNNAIYLNSIGTALISGGTITSNGNTPTIYINGGASLYRDCVRLSVTGGTITNKNTGSNRSAHAICTSSNAYGVVDLSGGTITNSNNSSYSIYVYGVKSTTSSDDGRKNFKQTDSSNVFSRLNISGTASIGSTSYNYAIQSLFTPINITGGTIASKVWTIRLTDTNNYVVMKGGTINAGSGGAYSLSGNNVQQLYILDGTVKAGQDLVYTTGTGSATAKAVNISGGTFTGGAYLASSDRWYIDLCSDNTTLNISGGTFGSSDTALTAYTTSNSIQSNTFIAVRKANITVNVTGGVFSLRNSFINTYADSYFKINISGSPVINGFNNNTETSASTIVNSTGASGMYALFMLNKGSLSGSTKSSLNIFGSPYIKASNGTAIYCEDADIETNIIGGTVIAGAQSPTKDNYIYYGKAGTINIASEPSFVVYSTSLSEISVLGKSEISARATIDGTTYNLNKNTTDNLYIEYRNTAKADGDIVVINAGISVDNYLNFALVLPLDYYLEYNSSAHTLILRATKYYIMYNRNFMMNKTIANVGNFGSMGTKFTEVYPQEGYSFVEGYTEIQFGTSAYLLYNAFARTGYTFKGWGLTQTATTTDFANHANINLSSTPASGIIQDSISGKTMTPDRISAVNPYNAKSYSLRLYAIWGNENYSVTLSLGTTDGNAKFSDSTTANKTVSNKTYGSTLDLSSYTPVRQGYEFGGWAETQTISVGGENKQFIRIYYYDPYDTNSAYTSVWGSFQAFNGLDTETKLYNCNPSVYKYSNIGVTEQVKDSTRNFSTDKYTYYIEYDKVFINSSGTLLSALWTQTSNMTTTKDSCLNFSLLSSPEMGQGFNGLSLSRTSQAYIDGNSNHSNWYYYILPNFVAYQAGQPIAKKSYYATLNGTHNYQSTSFPVSLWQQIGDGNEIDYSLGDHLIGQTGVYYVKGTTTLTALWHKINYEVYLNDDYEQGNQPIVRADTIDGVRTAIQNPANYVSKTVNGSVATSGANATSMLLLICGDISETYSDGICFGCDAITNANVRTLNIKALDSHYVWGINMFQNLFAVGGASSEVYTVNISDITISQTRNPSSTSVNTGRFMHVNSTGVININANTTFTNFALNSTWNSILWANGGTCNINDGAVITNNYTAGYGTFICGYFTLNVNGGTFYSNTSACSGGVFYISSNSTSSITINGGTFYSNTAGNAGGVIGAVIGTVTMYNGTLGGTGASTANKATNGGAIYIGDNATLKLKGGVIGSTTNGVTTATATDYANCATNSGGGVYSSGNLILSYNGISSCTISYNASLSSSGPTIGGGGIACSGTTNRITTEWDGKTSTTITNVVYNYGARAGGIFFNSATNDATVRTLTAVNVKYNSAYWAGGIMLTYGKLKFDGENVVVSNNTAVYGAGGLWVDDAFTLANGTISNNTTSGAEGGGAIVTNRDFVVLQILGGTISNNTATSGPGGAIKMIKGSSLTISGGTISGNKGTNGGGIYATAVATFKITGGTISNNTATSSTSSGGGIWTNSGLTITGGTISGNTAVNCGGGVYVGASAFSMTGGTISNNSTTGTITNQGGGLALCKCTSASITGGTISGNTANKRGGGIMAQSCSLTINGANVEISNNTAKDAGGGINFDDDAIDGSSTMTLTFTAGKIHDNSATSGGGIYLEAGEVTFNMNGSNALIYSNKATSGNGGGVCLETWSGNLTSSNTSGIDACSAVMNMSAGQIYSNSAIGRGGAIYVANAKNTQSGTVAQGKVNITGGVIGKSDATSYATSTSYSNYSSGNRGGGIYNYGGIVNLSNCVISYNASQSAGGGIAFEKLNGAGSLTFSGTVEVKYNSCLGSSGGGIYYSSSDATFNSGAVLNVYGNWAVKSGGGIHSDTSITLPSNYKIYSNTSNADAWSEGGGGVSVTSGSCTINGASIYSNTAVRGGGVYFKSSGILTLSSGNIYGNTSSKYGGGVYTRAGTFNFYGGVIGDSSKTSCATSSSYSNSAKLGGSAISLANTVAFNMYSIGSSVPIVAYNSVTGTDANLQGGIFVNTTGACEIYQTSGATGVPIIRYNYAARGGGIYVYNNFTTGTDSAKTVVALTLSACKIYGNTAVYGGGIALRSVNANNYDTLTINNDLVEIYSNKGTIGYGGIGTVGSSYATITMTAGKIYSNTSSGSAGGIAIESHATLNLSGGTIYTNTATSYGGGIAVLGGTLNLSGGTIYTNTATSYGGGAYVSGGTLNMTGGVIGDSSKTTVAGTTAGTYSNTAGNGGGVYVNSGGTFKLTSGTIAYNYASAFNNSSTYNWTGGGGGIFSSGSFTMSGGSVAYNRAYGGAGIYLAPKSTTSNDTVTYSAVTSTITGGSVSNNYASQDGGGIYVGLLATLNFSGGCVGNSSATAVATSSSYSNYARYGAGIYSRGTLNMSGTASVKYNKALQYGAGVSIICQSNSLATQTEFKMTAGTIAYNLIYAGVQNAGYSACGGALMLQEGKCLATISGGEISNNKVEVVGTFNTVSSSQQYDDANGAGIGGYSGTGSNVTISGTTQIINNQTKVTVTKTSDYSNTLEDGTAQARTFGTAICLNYPITLNISDSVQITNNSGTAIMTDNSSSKTACAYAFGTVRCGSTTSITGSVNISSNTLNATATSSVSTNSWVEIDGAGLLVNGDLTIAGTSENSITISNNTINSTCTNTGTGTAQARGYGAGVYNTGGDYTFNLSNAYIHANVINTKSTTASGQSTSTIAGSGIFLSTTFVMESGEISGNYGVTNTSSTSGNINYTNDAGGLWADTKTVTIKGGSFTNNSVTQNTYSKSSSASITSAIVEGGAMWLNNITTSITNCTISNNTATNKGGGIFVYGGTATLGTGTKIFSNSTSYWGGGVSAYPVNSNVTLNIAGANIYGNVAGSWGGGVCMEIAGTLNMTSGTIGTENKLATSTDYSNKSNWGGGLAFGGTTLNLTGGTIAGNYSTNVGGGVGINKSGTATLDGILIYGNGATNSGGGVYIADTAKLYVKGSTVIGNDTYYNYAGSHGGGIYSEGSSSVIISGGTIGSLATTCATATSRGNQASYGGGIKSYKGSLTISGGTIGHNWATGNAGGICSSVTTTISGGNIQYNGSAIVGGGIIIWDDTYTTGTLTMTGGTIAYNYATTNGGGLDVYSNTASATISGGTIANNTANTSSSTGYGGGIYSIGILNISGGVIGDSTKTTGATTSAYSNLAKYGGGVFINGGTFTFTGGTIAYNRGTTNGGGGLYIHSGIVNMSGTATIKNNVASWVGADVCQTNGTFNLSGGTISNATSWRSCIESTEGTFNMTGGTITSVDAHHTYGTVYVRSSLIFNFSGGTINNQSDGSSALMVNYADSSSGYANISGGTLSTFASNGTTKTSSYPIKTHASTTKASCINLSGSPTLKGNSSSYDIYSVNVKLISSVIGSTNYAGNSANTNKQTHILYAKKPVVADEVIVSNVASSTIYGYYKVTCLNTTAAGVKLGASYNSTSKEIYLSKAVSPTTVIANSNLVYNRAEQSLVTPQNVTGTMHYNVGSTATSSSSTIIPQRANAGTYTVYWYVESTDDYLAKSGSVSVTIKQRSITASEITVSSSASSFTYNGTAQKPTITITDSITGSDSIATLTLNSEYATSFPSDVTSAGSKTVTITGKGNYTGSRTVTYTINTAQITDELIKVNKTTGTYVADKGKTYYATAYYVMPSTATSINTAKIYYSSTNQSASTDTSKYAYSLALTTSSQELKDVGRNIAGTTTVYYLVTATNYTSYTGSVTITVNKKASTIGTTSNINLTYGATVTVSFTAEGDGSLTVSSSGSTIIQIYSGPTTSSTKDSKTYTITLRCLMYSGVISITAKFSAGTNYTESTSAVTVLKVTPVKRSITSCTFNPSSISDVEYTGSAIVPSMTITDTIYGKAITLAKATSSATSGNYYTSSISSNINGGTATYIFAGTGNYSGSKTFTFNITPKTPIIYESNTEGYSATLSEMSVEYGKQSTKTIALCYVVNGTPTPITDFDGNINVSSSDETVVKVQLSGLNITVTCIKVVSTPVTITVSTSTTKDTPNYGVAVSKTFTVKPVARAIKNASIAGIENVTYTGEAFTPTPAVTDSGLVQGFNLRTTLVNGTDFTYSYSNNINAGSATITITGKGNYSGTQNAIFIINKAYVAPTLNSLNATAVYGEVNSSIKVVLNKSGGVLSVLSKDTSSIQAVISGMQIYLYCIKYVSTTVKVDVKSAETSNYQASSVTFIVTPAQRDINNATIANIESRNYTGEAFTPTPAVTDSGVVQGFDLHTTLVSGTDFTYSYSNNINAGTATVTIKSKGNYKGSKSKTFAINQVTVAPTLNSTSVTVVYGEVNSSIKVATNGSGGTLTVSSSDANTIQAVIIGTQIYLLCKKYSTATVTVTVTSAKTNNYFSSNVTFSVKMAQRNISKATIGSISAPTYTGSALTPTPAVTDTTIVTNISISNGALVETKGKTLSTSTDFTYSYSNNINAGTGTATVTITGKGNYKGTKSQAFSINKASQDTIKATGKTLTYTGSAQALVTLSSTNYGLKYTLNGTTQDTIPTAIVVGTYTITITANGDSNHNATSSVTVTATINKKAVTVTAKSTSYTYDGSKKSYASYTTSGIVSSHTATVSGFPSVGPNVGTYSSTPTSVVIKDSGGNDVSSNYNISTVKGTITINKRAITITTGSKSWAYDGTAHSYVSYSTSNLVSNHTTSFTSWPTITKVKESSVQNKPTLAGIQDSSGNIVTSNYNITWAYGSLTVTKGTNPITITGVSGLKYTGSAQVLTNEPVNNIDKLTVYYNIGSSASTSSSTDKPTATKAGTYTVYWYCAESDNLNAKSGSLTVTIAKATGNITSGSITNAGKSVSTSTTSFDLIYGNILVIVINPTNTSSSFSVSSSVTASISASMSGTTVTIKVAGYNGGTASKVTVTSAADDNHEKASISYTVNPKRKSISSSTIGVISAQTYTGSPITPSVPTVTDTVYGSSVIITGNSAQNTGNFYYNVKYSNNTSAGTGTVTITGTGNYDGTQKQTFSINKASNTVSVIAYSAAYNGKYNNAVTSATATYGTFYYKLYGYSDTKTALNAENYDTLGSTTIPTIKDVSYRGTLNDCKPYTLYWYLDGGKNYESKSGYVNPKITNCNWSGQTNVYWSYTYDGSAHYYYFTDANSIYAGDTTTIYYTTDSSKNGSTTPSDYTYSVQVTRGAVIKLDKVTLTNVGTTYIYCLCWGGQNYTTAAGNSFKRTLTISKRPITITTGGTSWTYDGTAHSHPSYSISSGSLVSGQTLSITSWKAITNAGTMSNAPSASGVVIKNSSGTAVTSNYNITWVYGTLTVNKGTITYTSSGGGSKVYGSTRTVNVVLNSPTNYNIKLEWAIGSKTYSSSTTLNSSSNNTCAVYGPVVPNVGTYYVYFKLSDPNENYNPIESSVTVGVTQAANPLTVVASSGLTYNGSAQQLLSSVSGQGTIKYSVDGGTATTTKPTRTNAGTYSVKVTAEGNGNYKSATKTVTVTIAKATLSVTMYDCNETYDGNFHNIYYLLNTKTLDGSTPTLHYTFHDGSVLRWSDYNTSTPMVYNSKTQLTGCSISVCSLSGRKIYYWVESNSDNYANLGSQASPYGYRTINLYKASQNAPTSVSLTTALWASWTAGSGSATSYEIHMYNGDTFNSAYYTSATWYDIAALNNTSGCWHYAVRHVEDSNHYASGWTWSSGYTYISKVNITKNASRSYTQGSWSKRTMSFDEGSSKFDGHTEGTVYYRSTNQSYTVTVDLSWCCCGTRATSNISITSLGVQLSSSGGTNSSTGEKHHCGSTGNHDSRGTYSKTVTFNLGYDYNVSFYWYYNEQH